MNRILFEKSEISQGIATLPAEDSRAKHILGVLKSEKGDILKTGEIDGLKGVAEILEIDGGSITLAVRHEEKALEPWVDLILAPPRPRVLKRLFPQIASLGVGRIFLVGAKKVEKDFWGATLLKEEIYRPLLVDGLTQAGTCALPTVSIRRNFRKFVNDELDGIFATKSRIVAHPGKITNCAGANVSDGERLLLAVGPEGGWTDEEVALLEGRGFRRYSLGERILRTDTALIALLAKLG